MLALLRRVLLLSALAAALLTPLATAQRVEKPPKEDPATETAAEEPPLGAPADPKGPLPEEEIQGCIPGTFTNTSPPVVSPSSGYPGTTFSSSSGSWVACSAPIQYYVYSWLRNGSPIANGSSYTATNDDVDKTLQSRVSACNDDYGCSAPTDSSGVSVTNPPPPPPPTNNPPLTPSELAFPVDIVTSNQDGPFRIKYVDPEGQNGSMTYRIYRASDNALIQTLTVGGIVTGEARNGWLNTGLSSGLYYWNAYGTDASGASGGVSANYSFLVNRPPPTPTLDSPTGSAAAPSDVPVINPVLRASAVDPEGDEVGYEFKVTSDTGCSTLAAGASSGGFLPLMSTWTVPVGTLKDGGTYYWCVRAEDYVARDDGPSASAWSAVGGFRVRLPKLGLREQWPLWSHGPLAVNQATGNLVLSLPGPSYPFATGEMAVSLSYNSKAASTIDSGLGPRWTLDAGAFAGAPAKLIDRNLLAASERFDAFERVSGDGGSDFYNHVGSSSTYLGAPGDGSQVTKHADGSLTLLDPDGAVYSYGPPGTGSAEYVLRSAEFVDADPGKTKAFYCLTGPRLTSIRDTDCSTTPTRELRLSWNALAPASCSDAILCVQGPDNVVWKYFGDGAGGTSGQVVRVHNGTRAVFSVGYGGNGLPSTLKNANDLNPPVGHDPAHSIAVEYDGLGRVSAVLNGPITGQTPGTSKWSFAYSGSTSTGSTRAAHAGIAQGASRTAEGVTELTPPRQQGVTPPKTVRTYYDNLGRTIQVTDLLGNVTMFGFDDRDQLAWAEDEDGNPTDYTWGDLAGGASPNAWVNAVLLATATPDPDGPGGAARPETRYRYDETSAPMMGGAMSFAGEPITDRDRAAAAWGDGRLLDANQGTARSANKIWNAGFETDTSGWGVWQGTIERSTTVARSGSASGKAVAGATGGYSAYFTVPLTGDTRARKFTVSAWVYVPAGSPLIGDDLDVSARSNGGAEPWEETWSENDTLREGWQRITATHTISRSDRSDIQIQAYVSWSATYAPGDYFYIDDAEIVEHDTETNVDSSVGIWRASTNILSHGDLEEGSGSAGAWQGSWSRTTEQPKFGRWAARIAATATGGFTAYSGASLPASPAGRTYSGSAWVYVPAGSALVGDQIRALLREHGGATAWHDVSTIYTLRAGWQRITTRKTIVEADRTYIEFHAFVRSSATYEIGDHFYLDGIQIEEQPISTPFIATNGAAASRTAASVQAPANTTDATQGWIAARVRIGFDLAAQDVPILSWGSVTNGLRLYWRNGSWDARRGNSSAGTQLLVSQAGLQRGDRVTLVYAWNGSEIKLSVNGAPFSTGANATVPSSLPATFEIGAESGSNARADSDFLWLAAGTGLLGDADAQAIRNFVDEVSGPWAWPGAAAPKLLWTADTTTFFAPDTVMAPRLKGLQAWYYDNPNLAGRPKARQTDAEIDFDWGAGGPAALAGRVDDFSVRWTGEIAVATGGDYTFSALGGDGYRLIVDNKLVIDSWLDSSPATVSSQPVTLTAGQHRVVLEYRERTGPAAVELRWSCPCGVPAQVVPTSVLYPAWLNRTTTIAPSGRSSFEHFKDPSSGRPDYTLSRLVEGRSVITSFEYDGHGRVTRKVMPKGNAKRTIDTVGELTGTADARFATTYAYYGPGESNAPPGVCGGPSANQAQLLKSTTPYGVAATSFVYDAAGRMVARSRGVGTTCSGYDAEGRLVSARAPGDAQATTFTYDPAGQLLSASDASGSVSSSYDEAGRVTRSVDSFGAEARLTYDAEGNLVRRLAAQGPFGSNTQFESLSEFDAEGKPTRLTDPAGRVYGFFYDPRGSLKATQYPNGTFSWSETDRAGRLTGLYNRHGLLSSPLPGSVPADASPLADYAYTYDLDARKTSETRTGGGLAAELTRYGYDGLGRLELAVLPTGVERQYRFDLDSNRTAVAEAGELVEEYLYDPARTAGVDQLSSVSTASGSRSFGYDADGRTVQRGSDTLGWDGWDRHTGGSFAGQALSYGFDPAGFRRQRTSGGVTSRYLLGGLFESDGAGTLTRTDVDGPAGDLAQYSGAPVTGSSVSFLYSNGHGDLAARADLTGARAGAFSYDPFGTPLQTLAANTASERWTGRWDKKHDSSSGLIEMGARPYDPALGRFLTTDPVDGASANAYDYVYQDPINVYDLDGRDPWGRDAWSARNDPTTKGRNRAAVAAILARVLIEYFGISSPHLRNLEWEKSRNGKGVIIRERGTTGPANTIRIMNPTARYPNGYVRYTDKGGRYIDPRTGKPTDRTSPLSHIDPSTYRGPWKNLPFE